jgi:hypothetical protein
LPRARSSGTIGSSHRSDCNAHASRATGFAWPPEETFTVRKIMLMSAALLGVGAASGYAQTGSAQTPPSPGASSQSVQPPGSLPPGAGTLAPGSRGIRPATGAADTGMPPEMHGRHAMTRGHHYAGRRPVRPEGGAAYMDPENPGGGRAPADQYSGVPPTSAYRGGAGSPFSTRATHIDRADTRSLIAPRLPDPDANGNTPQSYLAAAQRALARNQTGAAQEALERAQTRILTRSTDPSMASMPDNSGITRAITDARRALAGGDTRRAQSIIGQYLNNPG